MPSPKRYPRYNYFAMAFQQQKPPPTAAVVNNDAKKPFSDECLRFMDIDGYVFCCAADNVFHIVFHTPTSMSIPALVNRVARWNHQEDRRRNTATGIYPLKSTATERVLPVTMAKLDAQLKHNPVLRKLRDAQVPAEGRWGFFQFLEECTEPTLKKRHTALHTLLLPEGRLF